MPAPALKQTTLRVDPEVLRKVRFHLAAENKSVNEFLAEQLEAYLAQHEANAPDRARRTPAPTA